LIGFINNERSAETFVVMWKDETEEVEEKSAVEEGKRQSENSLLQILPKVMIM
jgi:hypothetical protein